jgi:Tol biopolymer transport system component
MKKILSAVIILFLSRNLFAQFTEFHPELDWYTIKGKHVEVHFHNGAERTAKVVAKIADEVWGPITSLYQYEPSTVHFVIKDLDDYSNGATYFFDNKIEIWTSALDFDLRGTHNWLRNVISHEFTHMVQIQSAMKLSRSLPAVFLQLLNYQEERRPDILYGYPNYVISYPIATVNVPAWFAEGTAQYMRQEFDYDNWDTQRDMILRCYALGGNMLTWNQMGVFGKTSLGNESVYNSGFALTRYISQKYGEDKLREITKKLGSFGNFTIDGAFEDVLGKNGNEIYTEWQNYLVEDYTKRSEKVLANLVEGEKIADKGFGNFYPTFSKDGKKIYYISNKSSDYFSPSGIYEYDIESGEDKLLVSGVRSTYSWIPGQNKILYAKISENNPNWYNVHDLFIYDVDKADEIRLTENLRANQPSISNDGKKIVFLFQKDGTTNLGTVDINPANGTSGKNFQALTSFKNGEQVYNPKFSDDDSYIIFDYSYHQTRDIAKVSVTGGEIEFVLQTDNDERNPTFDKYGNLVYASDETGIFNIYSLNTTTNEKKQLTNVIGGAFMPGVNENGDITYAGYTSEGFKIFLIKNDKQKDVISGDSYVWRKNPPLDMSKPNGDINNFDINALKNFNDYETPDYQVEKYKGAFSTLTFFPFIRFDNYNTGNTFGQKIKPGLYVSSNDMLNRYSIFAGAAINTRLERDLFFIFEFKNKLPLISLIGLKPELSAELYSTSRKADVDVLFGPDTVNGTVNYDQIIPTEVTYNLLEFDLAAKHRIFNRYNNLELRFIFSRYISTLGSFLIQTEAEPILYPTTDDTYFIGRDFRVSYKFEAIANTKDDDINPIGAKVNITYDYEWNRFNNEGNYTVEDGLLKPVYNDYNFHRILFDGNLYIPLWADHTLSTRLVGGTILGPAVPDFFDFYLGGLIGFKAYPFYALSGNEIAWINLTYRLPLWRDIDYKLSFMYFDKIFLSFHFDYGNAWTGNIPALSDFKKGAGTEIRLQMNSYYLFPTALFFNASYGFDKFDKVVDRGVATYGQEWRFYGGILFGFDIVNNKTTFTNPNRLR